MKVVKGFSLNALLSHLILSKVFNLRETHLEGACLTRAHLEEADLERTHLEGADLYRAHLEGASLSSAYLAGASLRNAYFDTATNLSNVMFGNKKLGITLTADIHW